MPCWKYIQTKDRNSNEMRKGKRTELKSWACCKIASDLLEFLKIPHCAKCLK